MAPQETTTFPVLVARTAAAAQTTASSRMGPSGQPACDADQGQAPAFLDPGQPLLVHAGGVDFQLQQCPLYPAALRSGPASSPGGGD